MSNLEDIPPLPKIEPFEEESFSESSPEPEEQSLTQEPVQVQKRKGGRKPVRNTQHVFGVWYLGLIASSDICNLRRTQTAQSPGTGRIQGAPD